VPQTLHLSDGITRLAVDMKFANMDMDMDIDGKFHIHGKPARRWLRRAKHSAIVRKNCT